MHGSLDVLDTVTHKSRNWSVAENSPNTETMPAFFWDKK